MDGPTSPAKHPGLTVQPIPKRCATRPSVSSLGEWRGVLGGIKPRDPSFFSPLGSDKASQQTVYHLPKTAPTQVQAWHPPAAGTIRTTCPPPRGRATTPFQPTSTPCKRTSPSTTHRRKRSSSPRPSSGQASTPRAHRHTTPPPARNAAGRSTSRPRQATSAPTATVQAT
jgi:hypothetical protein